MNQLKPTLAAALLLALFVVAPNAGAQTQTKAQQLCSTSIDKEFSKIVKSLGKEACGCLKDISRSKAGTTSCVGNDRKDKVAKAMLKAAATHADRCVGNEPDFGFAGAGTAARAAKTGDKDLVAILFGDDLDAALAPSRTDAALAKCQQGVAKALKKCHDTRVKTYAACKKRALKDGATVQSEITACVTDDAQGKVAKACDLDAGGKTDKLRGAIAKSCVAVDLSDAFPACDTDDATALHGCLAAADACLACGQIAEVAGALTEADCDAYDNAASDNSCKLIAWENVVAPNGVEPAESPGTPGVTVTNPQLIEQFGSASFSLNNTHYTRFRLAGPEQTPDAILIFIAGFGGDANNAKRTFEQLIPRMADDHGLIVEVWGFHRRANQLEDREGVVAAAAAGDTAAALDWYYGDDLGLPLTPLLAAGPNRRANFYNNTDDIPFIANWTSQVASRDIDRAVEDALAITDDVFLAGHSAGTGYTARYAATDFNFSGVGDAEPGYGKLRGLVLFEGGGGSTLGDPITADSATRMVAKHDGGQFAAVRDAAPRCVDGTTPCTIDTEATDCSGQTPPVCTEPTDAYASFFGPELSAAAELAPIQAAYDANEGLVELQADTAGPGTAPTDLVPELSILNLVPDSTVQGLLGQFLDDDEIGASISAALANSAGKLAPAGEPRRWIESDGALPGDATPDNGPAPTALPAPMWGQEIETVRMSELVETFNFADSNAADWYYESAGLSVTSSPGRCDVSACTAGNVGAACVTDADCAQSIGLDSSAVSIDLGRPDIVNLTQAGDIDIPVICFGGSNGLTPVGASFLSFAQSIGACASPSCDGTARVVDESLPSEAFPTFGDIDGGYEVYVREGLAHVDVVAAEDGPEVGVIDPLAAFIARNVE